MPPKQIKGVLRHLLIGGGLDIKQKKPSHSRPGFLLLIFMVLIIS